MSKPQPKTKASELIDTLNGLSLDERKNQFKLKSLAREAKALAPIDQAISYMCQGIVSFYENKPDNVRIFFNNAIKISPRDSIVTHNYSVMLAEMGFYEEHLHYADIAYELNQADPMFLETALLANILKGKFDTAHELVSRATKLRLKSGRLKEGDAILQFIRNNSISPSDFLKLQDTAYSLLHSRNIFIMKPTLEILEDEDSMFLSYQILLDKPVSEIVDLSVMLAGALAHEPSLLEISDNVIISFSAWCE